jgi:hypothetical protein
MEIDDEGTLATLPAFRLVADGLISQRRKDRRNKRDSIHVAFGSSLARNPFAFTGSFQRSERQSLDLSPCAARSADVEADIPLSESDPFAPASGLEAVELEFWDSVKNSNLASEYEAISSNIPGAALSLLPEFVSRRSSKTASACATRTTGN